MKNLKQLTTELNYFNYDEIPAKYNKEKYLVQADLKDIPETLKGMKEIEVGVFYEIKQDTDYKGVTTFYTERYGIIFIKPVNSETLLMLHSYKGKFHISLSYELRRIYHDAIKNVSKKDLEGINEPNHIGVFTHKKVMDWINYQEKYLTIVLNSYNKLNSGNDAIKKEIEDLINSLPKKTVQRWNNRISIETPLFRIELTHHVDQSYLRKEITFKGDFKDIVKIEN